MINSENKIVIKRQDHINRSQWDQYVLKNPQGNLYHLYGWLEVIKQTYGHTAHYLAAFVDDSIAGILPLIQIKHFIFGNSLTSIPYFDVSGVLADNADVENALIGTAIKISEANKIDNIDLRQNGLLELNNFNTVLNANVAVSEQKVRMLMALPGASDELNRNFKSKLRSQIRKPYKSGLYVKSGWEELIHDFYHVFKENMRDLGSPVHSKCLIENAINQFRLKSKIFIVYKDKTPVAAGFVVGYKKTLYNPWASSLKAYRRLSPNMMLYWSMLKYACDNGYKSFDFGRSTPGEGTYRFKEQWGARAEQLYWYDIGFNGQNQLQGSEKSSKLDMAVHYWQKLPVPVSGVLGPMIRKYISL